VKNFNIAKQFSEFPTGRYYADTAVSGQRFREEFLLKFIETGEKYKLNMDDVEGYGSSFLEEAFGGLVRAGISEKKFLDSFEFVCEDDPTILTELLGYVHDEQVKAEAVRARKG
jgi:hypothetical protein